ncbi:MAG: hypothetical protein DMG67_02345 [Acidobacteria bacterium]|nr:MAG: hypothetical protein DMG67_02345 [Acidobacteriota bacterium]
MRIRRSIMAFVAILLFAATFAAAGEQSSGEAKLATQEKPAAPEKPAAKEASTKEASTKDEKPQPPPETVANPVTSTVRQIVERQTRNIVAAAEEMPAEKYDFHPTEAQMTFGHLISHIIDSNNFLCSRISDQTEPKAEVKDTDPKAKLVQALQASFDFCSAALQKADDSKLGDVVALNRGRKGPSAQVLIALTNDFADHYGAAAMYLRLNGMLPPTAQKPPAAAQK